MFLFLSFVLLQGCSAYSEEIISVSNIELISLDSPMISTELNELVDLTSHCTSFDLYEVNFWYCSPVVRWNQITREWVKLYYRNPLVDSRAYAMMSVAQQSALDEINSLVFDNESRLPNVMHNEIFVIDIKCKPFECDNPRLPCQHLNRNPQNASQ